MRAICPTMHSHLTAADQSVASGSNLFGTRAVLTSLPLDRWEGRKATKVCRPTCTPSFKSVEGKFEIGGMAHRHRNLTSILYTGYLYGEFAS